MWAVRFPDARNTEGSKCHSDLVMKPEDMSASLPHIPACKKCPVCCIAGLQVFKGVKPNIDSYSAFFDNCKANDTGLTKQLEYAGVTDVYCRPLNLEEAAWVKGWPSLFVLWVSPPCLQPQMGTPEVDLQEPARRKSSIGQT